VHRLLFRSSIFLASFLLFLSELIAAKQLLPIFGGSAAVWMTCLVFFQIALLAGYLYAHAISRSRLGSKIHIVLLVLAALSAIAWSSDFLPQRLAGSHPVLSIFAALTLSIGLPFVVLASTSPLLQVWLARLEHNAIPYRLFALSNLASLLALLAYPTLIEPHLSLTLQRQLWTLGVLAFALITAVISWQIPQPLSSRSAPPLSSRSEAEGSASALASSPLRHKLLWFLLPMAAAMQLSSVTNYLTSNIAAIPLLWILPLAAYLLSFILAFDFPRLLTFRSILLRFLAVMLASLAYLLAHTDASLPIGLAIAFFLVETFLACLFCHSEAYALRPQSPSESTIFYLTIAAGGATGSFLIGILTPLVFAGNYDLALTFLVTALLALVVTWRSGWQQRLLWSVGSALMLFLVIAIHVAYFRQMLLASRNFYGSLRVKQSVTEHGDPMRTLLNGSIQHGTQIFSPDLRHVPTTYYANNSGVGLALLHCCANRPKRIGVIGLGAGTIAAYGKPGDTIRFYEINPAVLPIAQNLFTWLRDSPAQLSFAPGDARTSLAAEPLQHFDVLVIDAFSGDAIPLHLLTVEAMAIYRKHLAPGGILAFHVSNQYVDLEPEIDRLAEASGMQARAVASDEDKQSGESAADWVLVTDNQAFLNQPDIADRTTPIMPHANVRAWTDNYSSLLPLMKWR
jgi:hypothetical protein